MGVLDNIESLFESVGFHISQRCCARPSCFDFVARKEKQLAFIKVQPNVGSIYEKDAEDLNTISKLFFGTPLFICDKTRDKPLEDDTVYSRYRVCTLTSMTLEDLLLKGMGPLIEAGPGGYYVRLDGNDIRKKRLEKGLSMGKMAELMGISRRTLYGYEREMAKASVSTAYKLAWVLGSPVAKPIDIFHYPEEAEGIFAAAKRMITKNRFLQFVVRKLRQSNFSVIQTRRAPFDFVAQSRENKTNFLGAIVSEREQNIEVRTEEIVSVSKIVEAQPILVADSERVCADNVPLIHREDFKKIKCPEDLIAKL
ncbi:MAG: helix-turn-helix domain-containing protein [Candidatus Bathyarchaeota archaeon]|nr:MAG: helix-turn-helix domain-containing protein [Candidatus Bathyarchaeota archaeon]